MAVEIKVPSMGESIKEVVLGDWLKKEGEWVNLNENLLEIESEKATNDLPSPTAGLLVKILKEGGSPAAVGEVIAHIDPNAPAPAKSAEKAPAAPKATTPPAAQPAAAPTKTTAQPVVMPAAQRELSDRGLTASQVAPSGPGGRLLKEDVIRHTQAATSNAALVTGDRQVDVVRMTPLRQTIAKRLTEAQHNAALLTTFNEIDMTAVMELRAQYKEAFEKRHGVKLGFMSFCTKAAVEALKEFPAVNAEIRGNDIVYHNYYDISVAVSGSKGLVVPVIRNAERLSFSEIEKTIEDFGKRAQSNSIKPEEMQGGTFTISNGGIFGSLMSTPIVNPPQSGILGLHAIQERPVARNGQVVIRSMMYVALTYDHRIVDGREAVTFLRRIKECMENPSRILLEI